MFYVVKYNPQRSVSEIDDADASRELVTAFYSKRTHTIYKWARSAQFFDEKARSRLLISRSFAFLRLTNSPFRSVIGSFVQISATGQSPPSCPSSFGSLSHLDRCVGAQCCTRSDSLTSICDVTASCRPLGTTPSPSSRQSAHSLRILAPRGEFASTSFAYGSLHRSGGKSWLPENCGVSPPCIFGYDI